MSTTPRNLALAGAPTGQPSARRHRQSLPGKQVSAGIMEATLLAPTDADFELERAFIRSNSTTPTSVTVYVGDVAPENESSYSDEGDVNEAEWNRPIWVPAGSTLLFRWEGGTAPGGSQLQTRANVQGWMIPKAH
jgi:hypothetical protein